MKKRPVSERLGDWRELALPVSEEESKAQASRCMDCGVPTCHQGCPLGNPIPDFNDHVRNGRWRAAYAALSTTNNFPEFTGRLCPAPCEAACVLGIAPISSPVTIEDLEKEIIERAFTEGWVVPRVPAARSGKRVAIVGSGPAGLAAAAQLNQAGHLVTVFERDAKPGGLLRYGIPDFKIEKSVVDRRIALLEAEGIVFRTGTDIRDWAALAADHDATLIAVGAGKPRDLAVHNRTVPGVVQAMEFLRVGEGPTAAGKKVVILGGGDTGSDCLGTALRQGATDVRQIELMPQPPGGRTAGNPWPQWPLVFRTSTSQEEGGVRQFGWMTTHLETGPTGLVALHGVAVDAQLRQLSGTEERIAADLLVLALGFLGPQIDGVPLNARGNVTTDGGFATPIPGVFAAGDAARGASLIVWAISDGREAARAMDAFLVGQASVLQTRGRDVPFGGR